MIEELDVEKFKAEDDAIFNEPSRKERIDALKKDKKFKDSVKRNKARNKQKASRKANRGKK